LLNFSLLYKLYLKLFSPVKIFATFTMALEEKPPSAEETITYTTGSDLTSPPDLRFLHFNDGMKYFWVERTEFELIL